jgi:hypothetical protein
MLPWLVVGTAWDEQMAELSADIILALRRADLTNQQAALYMWGDNKHESLLSHALAGRRPLNVFLLSHLPQEFWIQFLRLRALRVGREVVEHGFGVVLEDVRALLPNMRGREVA